MCRLPEVTPLQQGAREQPLCRVADEQRFHPLRQGVGFACGGHPVSQLHAAEAGIEQVRAYVESCASYERTSGGETYASSTLTPFDVEVDGADAALGYAEKQADGFVFLYVYAQAGEALGVFG